MSSATPRSRTEEEIREWIVARLAGRLRVPRESIDLDEAVVRLGVDSMQFVVLVGELEDWLGCRFVSNPMVSHPSINALSRFLARQVGEGRTKIDPAAE